MVKIPEKAFIFAAGKGTRLRPYTDHVPKPMVKVGGQPIIDRSLDALAEVGVKQCGVNSHYKAEVLHAHLAERGEVQGKAFPALLLSHEEVLLDTGGGLVKMKQHFDEDFYVVNGDAVWEDAAGTNLLRDMAAAWDPVVMDILIVLQPVESMVLTQGVGDYDIDAQGRAVRTPDKSGGYMFTSLRINSPRILDGAHEEAFSYLELLDKAEAQGRLYAYVNKGAFHHISTPADLEAVNKVFLRGAA